MKKILLAFLLLGLLNGCVEKAKNKEEKTETSSLHSVEAERYLSDGENKYALFDLEEAILDYNKAIELDSKNPITYMDRAWAKYHLQDYRGAVSDSNKAIKLNPEYAEAYHSRSYAKYKLKDFDGSISDFDKAEELEKANELNPELKNPNKN